VNNQRLARNVLKIMHYNKDQLIEWIANLKTM